MTESVRQAPPMVRIAMCCAGERAPAIDPIRAHFVRRGAAAELVPGVDSNSGLLISAIERAGRSGLYVMFRTAELGPLQIDVLKQLLAAHGVPSSRCIVLQFDAQKPQAAVRAIVAALSPPTPGGSLSQVRGRITRTTAQTPSGPPLSARLATQTAASGTSQRPPPLQAATSRASSSLHQQNPVVGPPPRPTMVQVSAEPRSTGEPLAARSGTIASPSLHGTHLSGVMGSPSLHDAGTSGSIDTAALHSAAMSETMGSRHLPRAELSGIQRSTWRQFSRSLLRSEIVARVSAVPRAIRRLWHNVTRDRKARLAFAGSGVGVACMAAMMLVVCQAERANPSSEEQTPVLAAAQVDGPAVHRAPGGEQSSAAADLPLVVPPESEPPATAGEGALKPAADRLEVDDPIDRALLEREIRSLDVLLFVPESTQAMRYQEAVKHCESKEVGGVGGWRLASIGELNTLARAKMLNRRHVYWSQTSADTFGDQHLALFSRSHKIYARSDRWRGARAFCVRTRTPSGEPVPGDMP